VRITVLYRPDSEHARDVEMFIHDYQRQHGDTKIDVLNLDQREGAATASLYDIMEYPAILALRDDGSAANIWQGQTLPLMDEVAAFAFS